MKYFKAQSLLSSKRNKRIAITVALLVCIAGLTIVITRAGGFFVGVTPSQGTNTSAPNYGLAQCFERRVAYLYNAYHGRRDYRQYILV
jgi:hypothetical protein